MRPANRRPILAPLGLLLVIVMVGAVVDLDQNGPGRSVSAAPLSLAVAMASDQTWSSAGLAPIASGSTRIGAGFRRPSLAAMVGVKLVIAMAGTSPTPALLGRIERGEIGGVILFGSNVKTAAALRVLITRLQAAARAGGQPPLLIAVDQEGGSIKRISWAPPTITVPKLGQLDSSQTARLQGVATGTALARLGINLDLAPVADVPASTSSFMYQAGRTFSFNASITAAMSNAFSVGLEESAVLPTMKHFPGIGYADKNTDSSIVLIKASAAALAAGLLPYKSAIKDGIPLIMLSNATYSAYDAKNAAGWSQAISVTLLRTNLGFGGVTITDSLDGTAGVRGVSESSLALRAAMAGTDMILLTGSEAMSNATYATLLTAAQNSTIPYATLQASYNRIAALKAGL